MAITRTGKSPVEIVLLLLTLTSLCVLKRGEGFVLPQVPSRNSNNFSSDINRRQQQTTRIWAESKEPPSSSAPTKKKAKGVYVRPSAVIEKGSGFFFPGLEGPRVRLFVGTVILFFTGVNHILSSSSSLNFSEVLAILYSLLVLFQGAIESFREAKVVTISRDNDDEIASTNGKKTTTQLSQQWSSNSDKYSPFVNDVDGWKERVQWAATTFLSLTPASHIFLLSSCESEKMEDVVYYLGNTGNDDSSIGRNKSAAIQAALNTLSKSKGGLVALPSDHPAYSLAPKMYDRSVILQEIPKSDSSSSSSPQQRSCFMVTSDQLVASFTKQDLLWFGQLARYVGQK